MAQLLVQDIPDDVLARLCAQAERHGQSLEDEARSILVAHANGAFDEKSSAEDFAAATAAIRARLAGRSFGDVTELIREDREHGHWEPDWTSFPTTR